MLKKQAVTSDCIHEASSYLFWYRQTLSGKMIFLSIRGLKQAKCNRGSVFFELPKKSQFHPIHHMALLLRAQQCISVL